MKSSLLRDLSRHYESSASVLLQTRQWSASYHLAGLSVEFALKACIAKTFARNAIPDKRIVQQVYTHEPARLVVLAGLEKDRLTTGGRSPTFARFWTTVSEWDADSRYQRWSRSEASSMFEAVTEPTEGVIGWIRSHW